MCALHLGIVYMLNHIHVYGIIYMLYHKKNIDTNVCLTFRNSIHVTFEQ